MQLYIVFSLKFCWVVLASRIIVETLNAEKFVMETVATYFACAISQCL